jgi:hypothetical protein
LVRIGISGARDVDVAFMSQTAQLLTRLSTRFQRPLTYIPFENLSQVRKTPEWFPFSAETWKVLK